MKKLAKYSVLILIICIADVAFSLPPAPSGMRWITVPELTDEFNFFDANKWQKGHPYWSGRWPSEFNNNNVSFGNGLMRLQMTVKNPNRQGSWIWASCLTSKSRAFKKGMYAETQIKVANLSAVSSFWMQGRYSEIDVIENYGNVKNNQWRHLDYLMGSNTHYFINGWPNDIKTPKNTKNPGNERNADRYFTYGVWWKDSRNIILYRDGVEIGKMVTGGPFNENMYMFFDMEPFTWGPGLPSVSDLRNGSINSAYYNYVRTYRLVNNINSYDDRYIQNTK